MDSPVVVRKRYQRFFAWTFVLATIVALGLVWVELAFPPPPVPAVAPAAAAAATAPNPSDFDLHDLQLLVTVAALVAALASFAGLVITTPLAWLEVRRERTRAAIETALKRQDRIDRLAAARVSNWPGGKASTTAGHLRGHLFGR
ncbi:hypothetical protein J7E62_23090 [Variovorax paradoxus]|nr:hypothetical protein [Variovorax paradoxus]